MLWRPPSGGRSLSGRSISRQTLRGSVTRIGGGAAYPAWLLVSGQQPATLDVDFVNDRAFLKPAMISIASLLACSRASSGYYTKADGTLQSFGSNTLRYGTNGLLVEEARTNLALRSQELSVSPWEYNSTAVTPDAYAAPDGTMTADLVTYSVTNGAMVYQSNINVLNIPYAVSVYVRVPSGTANMYGGLFDGLSENRGAPLLATTEWQRYSFMVTPAASAGLLFFRRGDGSTTELGDLILWGVQAEAGSFATSYIPTTTGSATRAADVVTFSDLTWLDGASDSIYAEWVARNVNNAKVWAFDATNDKLLDEQTGMSARIAGATVGNTAAAGTTVKAAARMVVNDFAITMNGGTVATDVSETAPGTLSASRLGIDLSSANALNSYIRRVSNFKVSALADAALQTLTA